MIEGVCDSNADRQQTKRAVWFLYALEKEVCLQSEIVPVFLAYFLVSPIPLFVFFGFLFLVELALSMVYKRHHVIVNAND